MTVTVTPAVSTTPDVSPAKPRTPRRVPVSPSSDALGTIFDYIQRQKTMKKSLIFVPTVVQPWSALSVHPDPVTTVTSTEITTITSPTAIATVTTTTTSSTPVSSSTPQSYIDGILNYASKVYIKDTGSPYFPNRTITTVVELSSSSDTENQPEDNIPRPISPTVVINQPQHCSSPISSGNSFMLDIENVIATSNEAAADLGHVTASIMDFLDSQPAPTANATAETSSKLNFRNFTFLKQHIFSRIFHTALLLKFTADHVHQS